MCQKTLYTNRCYRGQYFQSDIRWAAKCVRHKVAAVPAMLGPTHTDMWPRVSFPATAESTRSANPGVIALYSPCTPITV